MSDHHACVIFNITSSSYSSRQWHRNFGCTRTFAATLLWYPLTFWGGHWPARETPPVRKLAVHVRHGSGGVTAAPPWMPSPPSPSGGSAAQRATADLTRQCSCAHETRTEDMDNLMCTRIPSSNCTRCMTCYSCSGACRVVAGPVGVRLSGEHCAGFQWTDAMDSRDPVGCSGCGSAATRS